MYKDHQTFTVQVIINFFMDLLESIFYRVLYYSQAILYIILRLNRGSLHGSTDSTAGS